MAYKFKKIPNHLAIIMDGNGRWATKRGLPRNYGHKEGVNAVERTINYCLKYGIKYCTFLPFLQKTGREVKKKSTAFFLFYEVI